MYYLEFISPSGRIDLLFYFLEEMQFIPCLHVKLQTFLLVGIFHLSFVV